jgi:hypothetical protein
MGRWRIRFAALSLLAALAGATPAEAAIRGPAKRGPGRLIVRTASTRISSVQGSQGSATAACPKGSRAVSGGWLATPTDPGLPPALVYESQRVGQRSWRTSALEVASGYPATALSAYVYCSFRARKASPVSATVPTTPGSHDPVSAIATCPRGRLATAGGFLTQLDSSFAHTAIPVGSRRAGPRSWKVTGYDVDGVGGTVKALAYCTPSRGTRLRTRSLTLDGPLAGGGAGAVTVTTPRCPKRIGARAGGFLITYDLSSPIQAEVSQSRRQGRAWRSTVAAIETPTGAKSAGFAYCN